VKKAAPRPARGEAGGRPPHQPPGSLRGRVSLARALSKYGVCSRKEAVSRIEAGRVRVGGRVVLHPSRRIDPRRDVVSVDGRRVRDEAARTVLLFHKPVGYITSRLDPGGRPTIYDLLSGVGEWVFPVGRLDRDTAGLLVLTNDHRLGHRLTDPGHAVTKTYHVRVKGRPGSEALRALQEGVTLEDGSRTRPAGVRLIGATRDGGAWLEMVLTEGRNRQVRRMCGAVGHDVLDLVRMAVGGLSLGDLRPGAWRRLEPAEIALLQEPSAGRP
jgi:23S rRNA pseudouridine2605 synthase